MNITFKFMASTVATTKATERSAFCCAAAAGHLESCQILIDLGLGNTLLRDTETKRFPYELVPKGRRKLAALLKIHTIIHAIHAFELTARNKQETPAQWFRRAAIEWIERDLKWVDEEAAHPLVVGRRAFQNDCTVLKTQLQSPDVEAVVIVDLFLSHFKRSLDATYFCTSC